MVDSSSCSSPPHAEAPLPTLLKSGGTNALSDYSSDEDMDGYLHYSADVDDKVFKSAICGLECGASEGCRIGFGFLNMFLTVFDGVSRCATLIHSVSRCATVCWCQKMLISLFL